MKFLLLDADTDRTALVCLAYAAAVIACIFLTRAIFSIPKIVRALRTGVYLNAMMAIKQGVDADEVKKVLRHMDGGVTQEELPTITKY